MKYTTNLSLKKPDYTDPVDIIDINDNMDTIDASLAGKANTSVQVVAGNGLTGGGNLTSNKTITLGTPTTVTNATGNSVTATGHTHALTLTKADITGLGIPGEDTDTTYTAGTNVSISGTNVISATNSTYSEISEAVIDTGTSAVTYAITGRRAKYIMDNAPGTTYTAGNGIDLSGTSFSVNAGNGLSLLTTGLSLGTPSTITNSTTNSTTSTSHTHALTLTKADITGLGIPGEDTTYTAGTNVSISSTNVISATNTNTTYSEISEAVINTGTSSVAYAITGRRAKYIMENAPGTTYTAGSNVQISGTTISATNTTYTLDGLGGAPSSRRITAGNGLSGGGTLAANRTITLGTPETVDYSTTNSVTTTGHTHALTLPTAGTTGAGIVKLNNTLTSTSTTEALTANQGRVLFQYANDGKATVASAIVGKGQSASGSDTFSQLALAIQAIETQSVLSGNAVASNVLSGKTFYSNNPNEKLTGTYVAPAPGAKSAYGQVKISSQKVAVTGLDFTPKNISIIMPNGSSVPLLVAYNANIPVDTKAGIASSTSTTRSISPTVSYGKFSFYLSMDSSLSVYWFASE